MAGTRKSGRKEIPPSVKDLKGTRRPWDENKERPLPDRASDFTPPPHLDEIGATEYAKKALLLDKLGVFKEGDEAALACYADAYSRWVHASKIVNATKGKGYLIKSKSGCLVRNPALAVVNQSFDQMYKFLTEFGLTPASRSRVKADGEKKMSEWDMFTQNETPTEKMQVQ